MPNTVSRRGFASAAAAIGASLVLPACSKTERHEAAAKPASAASSGANLNASRPEVTDMRFGIIALTDCSPVVIAHEKGLFKKYGINSTVVKGASWAAIRDSLSNGDIQATHMLLGMPIASSMGLLGAPKKAMVIPWLLNRNGQAITVKSDLKGKVSTDPKALKPLVDAAKKAGSPMTFAMTFPPGTHAMWMRYYLGAGGINPDKDVALVTVPPPQMVANMKVGKMDGFCVGEPWNARAIADGIGFTAITTQEIWKDHPEKVCAFTEEFTQKNPAKESEDGEGGFEGLARGQRVARRAQEPRGASRHRVPTYLYQLSSREPAAAPDGRLRLRRWSREAGRELHDLPATEL
jgi:nitrate/nitrite transport system substrate-binding protein